jgi:hypothetical protein
MQGRVDVADPAVRPAAYRYTDIDTAPILGAVQRKARAANSGNTTQPVFQSTVKRGKLFDLISRARWVDRRQQSAFRLETRILAFKITQALRSQPGHRQQDNGESRLHHHH